MAAIYQGKPSATVLVYPRATILQEHVFQSDNNIDYRVLDQGSVELELPRVVSISINKDYESDASTCEIMCYDPTNQLHPLGQNVDWGDTRYPALVPNSLIKTFQGYDSIEEQTGVWLIDEVTFNNPPDTIVIRCRDLTKLLLMQTLYPPILPDEFYPIGFCSQNDKLANEVYKNTNRWIPYTDLSEVVKCALRLAGFNSWNVESTGVMVTLEEMSQMMLMDIITRVKELIGYQFYLDAQGIPHFEHAPTAGMVIPSSRYLISQGLDIISISRRITDEYARSRITVFGKTLGGIGNVNIIPPQDIQHVDYENRQIYNRYCFGTSTKGHAHSGTDWDNFKQWVAGMAPGDSDDWGGVQWIPDYRRGSGANYYGMKCYNAVKNFQIANGMIWSVEIIRSDPRLHWAEEYLGQVGKNHKIRHWYPDKNFVGNFFGSTKDKWNLTHARVPGKTWIETIPGRTELEYEELRIVNAHVNPSHFLTPMRGQIRQATHSDEALENEAQCKYMAQLIDFWSNIHNNQINLSVVGNNRYDVGHVADMYEAATCTRTKVLITGLSSDMDLEEGSWDMSLNVFDLDPAEPITGVEPGFGI